MNTKKESPPLSRRKRFVFYLVSVIFFTILIFSIAEVIARLKGVRPYSVKQLDIVVVPGGKFYTPHPTLGYSHLPGQFKVTLFGAYTFKATNLDNTLRITHPLDTYHTEVIKPEIWIFGDSITYGWSVNDEEAYPWLVQEKFPEYEVVDFGVDGYGTLHSLIQLREAYKSGRKPGAVILAYGSWQDVRNTFIRFRRKMLVPASHLGHLNQPYASLTSDGKLITFMDTVEYREFPLMRYSAFIHAIENTYDKYEERHARSHEVTEAIIKEISDLCRSNASKFLVVGLTSDPTTTDIFEFCQREGIMTRDISVDLTIKENNNLPYDTHPSALAHQKYAQRLVPFLRSDVLKDLSTSR